MAVQYVLLPVLAQNLGLSYTQVGLLKATSSSAMALLEIPSGFLAEKFGEKRLLCGYNATLQNNLYSNRWSRITNYQV